MSKLTQRSATARIFSFIVLLGLLPAWFFYIGIKYKETMDVLEEAKRISEQYTPR